MLELAVFLVGSSKLFVTLGRQKHPFVEVVVVETQLLPQLLVQLQLQLQLQLQVVVAAPVHLVKCSLNLP